MEDYAESKEINAPPDDVEQGKISACINDCLERAKERGQKSNLIAIFTIPTTEEKPNYVYLDARNSPSESLEMMVILTFRYLLKMPEIFVIDLAMKTYILVESGVDFGHSTGVMAAALARYFATKQAKEMTNISPEEKKDTMTFVLFDKDGTRSGLAWVGENDSQVKH